MNNVELVKNILSKMMNAEQYSQEIKNILDNKELINDGMPDLWAALLKYDDEKNLQLLLQNKVYPNEKSHIVHHICFHYNCSENRRKVLEEKMNYFINILEKTKEGEISIIKDIEKYFKYYGKIFVEPEVYPLLETIYQKYTTEPLKIYYLEVMNQLKFFNTLQKSMFELQLVEQYTMPILSKLVNSCYWNKIRKTTFNDINIQDKWLNFCDKFKENYLLNENLPEKGHHIKKYKI